jgi:ferredoxin-NADP reductase
MAIPGKSSDMTATEASEMPARRLSWKVVEVGKVIAETPRVRSLLLKVTSWEGHLPGQHVDIRLTAADGYQAQRSYSIASAPEDEFLGLTVERVESGAVSPYLVDDLRVGDQFELRGPIGGYFVWTGAIGYPLCLIAGGSGIAPLMAMLRHRSKQHCRASSVLLYSSRSLEDVIYQRELESMAHSDPDLRIVHALTRKQPDGWPGHRGRINRVLLAEVGFAPERNPQIFVCGPTSFVEHISELLVMLGHHPLTIKTERFGPTRGLVQ